MTKLVEIIKGDRELAVEPETLERYLSDDWERKPSLMSEDSPTISGEAVAARQKLVKIFKGEEVLFCELDLTHVFEAKGWSRTPPEKKVSAKPAPKAPEPVVEAPKEPEKTRRERIIEVLHGLDKSDDSLWTSAGAPRLSEVSRLLGEKVDVDEVRGAIPDFRREQ